MKDGEGRVALSICGDPEDVKVFIEALREQYMKKQPFIGNICPMKMSFTNVGMTPYCETGSIEFKIVKKVNNVIRNS